MTIRQIIILFIFFPIVSFGQTDKGQLLKDSLTKKYIYKRDCYDNIIVCGAPTLIYKNKIKDTLYDWLYEIKIDSVLFGQTNANQCKTIFILGSNFNRRQIEQLQIFFLTPIFFTDTTTWEPYEMTLYYKFNGGLLLKKDEILKIESLHPEGGQVIGCNESLTSTRSATKDKKIKRDKFEKIIIKRQKNCH